MTGLPLGQILLPVSIDVTYGSVEELTLKTGGQSDVVNVESVPSAGALLQTGAGDDVVNTSPAGGNFEIDPRTCKWTAAPGTTSLNIHDENNPYDLGPGGGVYAISPTTVSRFKEHILFENVAAPGGTRLHGHGERLAGRGQSGRYVQRRRNRQRCDARARRQQRQRPVQHRQPSVRNDQRPGRLSDLRPGRSAVGE